MGPKAQWDRCQWRRRWRRYIALHCLRGTAHWAHSQVHPLRARIMSAHSLVLCAHFITLTFDSSSSLFRTPLTTIIMTSMWLLSLRHDFLLLSLRLPPVCLPLHVLPLQRRAAAGAQQEVHGKPALLRDQRGWGHLRRPLPPHRLWAQRPWLQRAPELIGPPLLQDPCRGPGRGWPDTRQDAHWSTPRTSRVLRTRRRVSQSVVVVCKVSDRSGQPDGDRSGQSDERESSKVQIRTLLEEQRQTILAECHARVSHHELQTAQVEEERRLLQGQLWQQKLAFREAHQRSLTEMEELRKFQSSAFDTIARRKFVEDQNTMLELSDRVQEFQNGVNCMNDSKDFQDAESICSGNSHVTSRPVSFPPHPIPEGMLRHSFVTPSRREGPPSIWDTHGISANVFCKSRCVIISTLSTRIASMEFIHRRAAPFVHSGGKWKTRTRSRSEMPVWTVSQRFSHLQWRRLFKELWSRPTTTADFGSSFRQFPTPATFACWKKRFKTEVCTCSQFLTKAMQWIKEVEMVDSVDDLKSSSSVRGISMPNFEVLDARIASALNKIIHNSHFKRRISLEQQRGPWAGPFPSWQTDCLLDLRILPGHWGPWFCRELHRPVHYCSSKWRYSGIRFKVGRNCIVYDENPTWWYLGRKEQIKNTRVWETQDRIGIVSHGDSSKEVRTWLSQIEDDGKKKYRAEFTK